MTKSSTAPMNISTSGERMGGRAATFSSRSLGKDLSPAGRKAAIGAEQFTVRSFGETPKRVGLGDKASVINRARITQPEVPRMVAPPQWFDAPPPQVNVDTTKPKERIGQDILKRTREFQIPFDSVIDVMPSDRVVQEQRILDQIKLEYSNQRTPKELVEPMPLPLPEKTPGNVSVEPISGLKRLDNKKLTAATYLNILKEKEAKKAHQTEDDDTTKRELTPFIQTLQTAAIKQVQTLQLVTQKAKQKQEVLPVLQRTEKIQTELKKQTALKSVPNVAVTVAQLTEANTQSQRRLARLPDRPEKPLQRKEPPLKPQKDTEDTDSMSKTPTRVPYSFDHAAAVARLAQAIKAGEAALEDKEDFEHVSGKTLVAFMDSPTKETTSAIVRDEKKAATSDATGVDGSEPVWRNDLQNEQLAKGTLAQKVWQIIKEKPPVKHGPGELVAQEDVDRVQRRAIPKKQLVEDLVPALPLLF